jgi:phasin
MSDVSSSKSKSKTGSGPVAPSPEPPKFETPRFEIPKFELPNMEVPAAFREFAERSVSQYRDSWEKMKAATEEVTDVMESSYASTTKGYCDYGHKVIEAARMNTNSAFDYAGQLMAAKSLSEIVELSTAHMRNQFETMNAQAKDFAALAQKIATDSVEPIKETVSSVFKKAA